jgi:Fic family protein
MFRPEFNLSSEITLTLSKIERLTERLNQSIIPKEVLSHVQKQCQVSLTHYSTQIEGNKLSMEQVSGVLDDQKTYGLVRDEKEVGNYFNLLSDVSKWIINYQKKINEELILQCHAGLLSTILDKAMLGKFREEQNAIYESGTGQLVYLPPEAKDVQGLVHDLCEWMSTEKEHPILKAAIFHNQFVTIHPFIDGNGRSARILSLYFLEAQAYDWKQIVPIDRYYAEDRASYYQLLQQDYSHNYYEGRSKTDFTPWIQYYVEGIHLILEGTLNQIELFKNQHILINNRQAKILKTLKVKKYITSSQYSHRFGISTRMASRDLRQLVQWGHISVIGRGRATRYFLK